MKTLDFALRLRMPDATPMQVNALTHKPQRQMRMPRRRLVPPPRCAVIHQHSFRNSTTLKRFFQLFPHRFPVRAAVGGQRDEIATVIVENRQRSNRLRPSFRSLEIHLPQFVGLLSFKTLHRWQALVLFSNQTMT